MEEPEAAEGSEDVNFEYAFKRFVNCKEAPEYVHFEHCYNESIYKEYSSSNVLPAKYLFISPYTNANDKITDEQVDVETVDHEFPLYYDPEKLNGQSALKNEEPVEFDDLWIEKIEKKDWNVTKWRLFKTAVQILEADYLSRLASKGIKEEVVRRHLIIKKTSSRFRQLYGSMGWDPPTVQWIHTVLLEKLPSCFLKIYTEAFQFLEGKVPSHLIEHMAISSSSLSVRSRIFGMEGHPLTHKKQSDVFSSALQRHTLKKIPGEPILLLLPINCGNSLAVNTRPFRMMKELSLLGTVVNVTCAKNAPNMDITLVLDNMINATNHKISELQTEHPNRPIVLVGMDSGSLIACHVALRIKVTAVVCLGFPIFTLEGKVGKSKDRLLMLKTPVLFIIGYNAATATVDEMEDFRMKLRCPTGLVVVGGADDQLRMHHFLKLKCSVTQSVVDRCIFNEVGEFLTDIIQPKEPKMKVVHVPAPPAPVVPNEDSTLLKKMLTENVKKTLYSVPSYFPPPIQTSLTVSLPKIPIRFPQPVQTDHEYGVPSGRKEMVRPEKSIRKEKSPSRKSLYQKQPGDLERSVPLEDLVELNKLTTWSELPSETDIQGSSGTGLKITLGGKHTASTSRGTYTPRKYNQQAVSFRPNFPTRKTRGGRRPYTRRVIPPKKSRTGGTNPQYLVNDVISNLTTDTLLDLPIVLADDTDESLIKY